MINTLYHGVCRALNEILKRQCLILHISIYMSIAMRISISISMPSENLRRMRRDPALGLYTSRTRCMQRLHATPTARAPALTNKNLFHMLPLYLLPDNSDFEYTRALTFENVRYRVTAVWHRQRAGHGAARVDAGEETVVDGVDLNKFSKIRGLLHSLDVKAFTGTCEKFETSSHPFSLRSSMLSLYFCWTSV